MKRKHFFQLRRALVEITHPEINMPANEENKRLWAKSVRRALKNKQAQTLVLCCFRIEFHLYWLWPYENIVSGKNTNVAFRSAAKNYKASSMPVCIVEKCHSILSGKISRWTNDTEYENSEILKVRRLYSLFINWFKQNVPAGREPFADESKDYKQIRTCWEKDKFW